MTVLFDVKAVAASMKRHWYRGAVAAELQRRIRSEFQGIPLAQFNIAAEIAWAEMQAVAQQPVSLQIWPPDSGYNSKPGSYTIQSYTISGDCTVEWEGVDHASAVAEAQRIESEKYPGVYIVDQVRP